MFPMPRLAALVFTTIVVFHLMSPPIPGHRVAQTWFRIVNKFAFSGFSVGFCINEEGYLLPTVYFRPDDDWSIQQNVGKLFSELNLLFSVTG